jgi:hypothetical protein
MFNTILSRRSSVERSLGAQQVHRVEFISMHGDDEHRQWNQKENTEKNDKKKKVVMPPVRLELTTSAFLRYCV